MKTTLASCLLSSRALIQLSELVCQALFTNRYDPPASDATRPGSSQSLALSEAPFVSLK